MVDLRPLGRLQRLPALNQQTIHFLVLVAHHVVLVLPHLAGMPAQITIRLRAELPSHDHGVVFTLIDVFGKKGGPFHDDRLAIHSNLF